MPFDGQPGALGQSNKPLYMCNPFVRSALIKGSFKTIVVLPKFVDQKEWVAVNRESDLLLFWLCHIAHEKSPSLSQVFDFFNNLNQFYGVLTEFCTIQNNPTMSAGVGCVALYSSVSNIDAYCSALS